MDIEKYATYVFAGIGVLKMVVTVGDAFIPALERWADEHDLLDPVLESAIIKRMRQTRGVLHGILTLLQGFSAVRTKK